MNKMTMNKIILSVLISITPLSTLSADNSGRFAIKGAGTTTCEQYIEERGKRSEAYFLITGWLNGYLTASNQYMDDTYDLAAWQNSKLLKILLETHCNVNLQQQIHIAIRAMVEDLKKQRLREFNSLVEAKVEDKEIQLYRDTIVEIQKKLINQGLYEGNADGKFGPATQKAVEDFQSKHQLTQTGLPDQATLYTLFIASAEQ